jgi:hypothetical protein
VAVSKFSALHSITTPAHDGNSKWSDFKKSEAGSKSNPQMTILNSHNPAMCLWGFRTENSKLKTEICGSDALFDEIF